VYEYIVSFAYYTFQQIKNISSIYARIKMNAFQWFTMLLTALSVFLQAIDVLRDRGAVKLKNKKKKRNK
jgi:hypothetical protein